MDAECDPRARLSVHKWNPGEVTEGDRARAKVEVRGKEARHPRASVRKIARAQPFVYIGFDTTESGLLRMGAYGVPKRHTVGIPRWGPVGADPA